MFHPRRACVAEILKSPVSTLWIPHWRLELLPYPITTSHLIIKPNRSLKGFKRVHCQPTIPRRSKIMHFLHCVVCSLCGVMHFVACSLTTNLQSIITSQSTITSPTSFGWAINTGIYHMQCLLVLVGIIIGSLWDSLGSPSADFFLDYPPLQASVIAQMLWLITCRRQNPISGLQISHRIVRDCSTSQVCPLALYYALYMLYMYTKNAAIATLHP